MKECTFNLFSDAEGARRAFERMGAEVSDVDFDEERLVFHFWVDDNRG